MKKIILFFVSLFLIGCASVPSGYVKIDKEFLAEKIENTFNDSLFNHAHWGVLIKSLNTGKTIYEKNARKMFMPASNEKIPTAAAALKVLGPDFNFQTTIASTGSIQENVLNGDLVIIGDGDPTLSDRVYEKPTSIFEIWADSLKSLGIDSINGNIIGDDNKFDDHHLGYGWPLSGLSYWYSAEFGALQLNENYIDLMFYPPFSINDSLIIAKDLESNYYSLINEINIADTGKTIINITREYGNNEIILNGNILVGSVPFERSPTITNPTKFYVTVFKEVLEKKGIKVSGLPIDCDDIRNYHESIFVADTLINHFSLPLYEILKIQMKRSQNLYAETLVKAIGLKEFGLGSFSNGKKIVEKVLEEWGIKQGTYSFMDGSGLSRYNFISPSQIVKILTGMKESEHWQIWYDILPIAGIDGTLKNRMKGTKAAGNVRAKTGTISNVRGLSGYITTAEGEELVFSFLVNGHLRTSRDTELITDRVLELISEYPYVKTMN